MSVSFQPFRPGPSFRIHFQCLALVCSTSLWLLLVSAVTAGDAPRLIEVSDSRQAYSGRLLAKNDESAWIMDEFGGVLQLNVRKLTGFRVVSEHFRTATAVEFHQKLRQEMPDEYEIAESARFIAIAPEGKASAYASFLDKIYRDVSHFYLARGLRISEPAVPLVVLIFGDQYEFRAYCERDNTRWSDDLRGYYSLPTNRVALFDDRLGETSESEDGGFSRQTTEITGHPSNTSKQLSGVSARTMDTLIHEVVHQIGFNTGVHSRFGRTPQWLVEGLAMHMESPVARSPRGARGADRTGLVNVERLEWFRREYAERRSAGDIASLVASDELFNSNPFDAYSLSWALACFLGSSVSGDRAQQFTEYLDLLKTRDGMEAYPASERLSDFRQCFGDVSKFEVEFLRFVEDLEIPARPEVVFAEN